MALQKKTPPKAPPPKVAPKQELAKKTAPQLPADAAVPDYMKGRAGRGIESLTAGDFEVPRLKLIQAISPELETFEGLKPGEFFHTLSEESLGTRLEIVPIYVDTRYILWNPRENGGGILARADDGQHWNPPNATFQVKLPKLNKTVTWVTKPTVTESGLAAWGSYNPDDPNSQPAATLMYSVVSMFPEHPEVPPTVVTLQRAAVRVARNLMGRIKISRAPAYGMKFIMTAEQEQGQSGPFYNYRFISDGLVSNKQDFEYYEEMYKAFAKHGVRIADLEQVGDEAPEAGGGTGPAPDRPAY